MSIALADDDLVVQLLAVKLAHIPPSKVRTVHEAKSRGAKVPLARKLQDQGLISRERCSEWIARGGARKILADLVRAEEAFWMDPCQADYGGYRVARWVAEGGRGIVLEAKSGSSDRSFAVKVLAERHSFDFAEIERFLKEHEILASLKHPGIVPAHRLDWVGSVPYYVMDFIKGTPWGTAQEMMQAPVWNVAVLLSVLDILQYLHTRRIVHGDMKPENVLMTPEGKVYLMDFGVAMKAGECFPEGTAVGTPAYMSPEQAEGGVPLDTRSDIYSAGAALYEALVHAQPYEGETKSEIVDKVLEGPPRRPREANPEVPEPLERVILKAMARSPRRRYATPAEMAEDLKRWRAGQDVLARPRRFWGGIW